MQISDVPDLAHTRPQAMHWLATATAMAAVVALAGLLQPGASASPSGQKRSGTAAGRAALPAPEPSRVVFPLSCGGAGTVVVKQASGDLDGDGSPETAVAVRCASGTGTPPSGVYVLTAARGAAPRIVATLVDPKDRMTIGESFAISDLTVVTTLLGYSGPDVPSCCPDEKHPVAWQWKNGVFIRSDRPEARSV